MRANAIKLLEFLRMSRQLAIPIYQRTYSWGEAECRQLWDDILRTGRSENVPAHFVGSIVYIERGLYAVSHQEALLVIDGQQRLTTVTLLLEALARHVGSEEPLEGFSARSLRKYLIDANEEDEARYKLLLTQTDKASLIAILDQRTIPTESRNRIGENFETFTKWIRALNSADLIALFKGLAKLVVVDISLDRDQDNPQLIFESLNSTGLELSQADLIRNYVLMGLAPKHQTRLYQHYWRPMELSFGADGYTAHFDSFMRHYLTVKTDEIPNVRQVYSAFKKYTEAQEFQTIEELVEDVRTYSQYYIAFALDKETEPRLKSAFHDLRELKVDTAYPFLLVLYHDYINKRLSHEEFHQVVRWIESYVFRRAISNLPTNSLNKTFATFARNLNKERYLESIAAAFLLMTSYKRFPDDEEFFREIQMRDMYNFPRRSYWLRRIENHGRKELVQVNSYTIEHIMPQKENLSATWRAELGPEWQHVHQTYLHRIGNLTLTGYNSEYSDRPFFQKRTMHGGFDNSPLALNAGLIHLERWNEPAIQARGENLARKALTVWAAPRLDPATLENYQPKRQQGSYSIEDHPQLASGLTRELFNAFRKEVLALDSAVTEEFLKFYIAYKAETNFVDVVPQAKRLRLSLNIPFTEIDDPAGMCKDVSQVSRWGNGDVEAFLKSMDELPYIIGLVRQALERQLGTEVNV